MKRIIGLFLVFISFSLIFFILYSNNSSESIQEEMKIWVKTKQNLEINDENNVDVDTLIKQDEIMEVLEVHNKRNIEGKETKIVNNRQDSEKKRVVESAIAILSIPSIDLEVAVSKGINEENLKYSVGHYSNSADFGQIGNACIVGHRTHKYNRFFYKLDKVKKDDTIVIDVGDTKFTYKVYDIFIVEPKDVWVFEQSDNKELTLITCTPIRVSTHRLIIKAQLI